MSRDIYERLHPSIQHDLYYLYSKPSAFLGTIAHELFEINTHFFENKDSPRVLLYYGDISIGHRHYIYFDSRLNIYVYNIEIGDISIDLVIYHDWTSFLNTVFKQISETLKKESFKTKNEYHSKG